MTSRGSNRIIISITVALVAIVGLGIITHQYWKRPVNKIWLQSTSNDYQLNGTFTTEERSVDDISLGEIAETYNAEVTVGLSWPGIFQIYPLSSMDCQELRNTLELVNYVASLRECRQKTSSPNPEEPDSITR